MNCEITLYSNIQYLQILIDKYIIFNNLDIFTFNKSNYMKLFINGDWVGYTDDFNKIKKTIDEGKELRKLLYNILY